VSEGTTSPVFATFTRADNPTLFKGYLKIKYEVFVNEMRWSRIPHSRESRTALPDHYDDASTFCAAVDESNSVIGVVRCTLPPRLAEMHRAEAYHDFGKLDFVKALDGRIGTINAMAVLPRHRWGASTLTSADAPRSGRFEISDHLMKLIVRELETAGAEVILLSAVYKAAYSLMRRIGFKMINPPNHLAAGRYSMEPSAPALTLCDMAIIIRDLVGQLPVSRGRDSACTPELRAMLNPLRGYLLQTDEAYRMKD